MKPSPDVLVSLTALPGFDPVGLRVLVQTPDDDRWHVGMRFDPTDFGRRPIPVWVVLIAAFEGVEPSRFIMGQASVLDVRLDLADSATRDRAIRWLAAKADGIYVGSGPPMWRPSGKVRQWRGERMLQSWAVYGSTRGECRFSGNEIPALTDLDRADDTRLPDGSRRVDAHALALVAVHLGQQVTP